MSSGAPDGERTAGGDLGAANAALGARRAATDLGRSAARNSEYVVIPAVRAVDGGAPVRAVPAGDRQIAGRLRRLCLARRLRHRVLVPEHAATLLAADPDRARGGDPRAHRPDHDRRRGRAGARRLRRGGDRRADGRRRPADRRNSDHGGDRASLSARVWVGIAGYLQLRARRQRDDLVAAADLHRHRDHELLRRRRACAISTNPNKPSTKPIGDAYMVGNIPGTDVHWGFAGRRRACPSRSTF